MTLRRALPLIAALSSTTCGSSETYIVVALDALEGVGQPTQLLVTLAQGAGNGRPGLVNVAQGKPAFPSRMVILVTGRVGLATLTVTALDGNSKTLGAGSASLTIVGSEQNHVAILLQPADFQINSGKQPGDQLFSTGATGRQVAGSLGGRFVVLWEDACPSGRCDIFGRLFDERGNPLAVPGGGTDLMATDTGDRYDMPAVAMASDGSFVAVWRRSSTSSPTSGAIYARAFGADGSPHSTEVRLSSGTATDAASPDIALRGDGTFVVVWAQSITAGGIEVAAVLLDATGAPADSPFTVAPSVAGSLPVLRPAVARGPTSNASAFVVVWNEAGTLKGLAFGADASATSAVFPIAGTPTGQAGDFDVATLPWHGYVVVFADQVGAASVIRLRRFTGTGEPLGADFTLNTSSSGANARPSIATLSDGKMLVAWSASQADQADGSIGIRGRALLPEGLPVGRDFAINTTTDGQQDNPSVAARGDSFVVAFEDRSASGPDTDGTGVRGRLVFPNFAPTDRGLGAQCAANDCDSGLICAYASMSEARCMQTCEQVGTGCSSGGTCWQADERQEPYCQFLLVPPT